MKELLQRRTAPVAGSTRLPQPKASLAPTHPMPPGSRQAGRVWVQVGAGEAIGSTQTSSWERAEPGHRRRPPVKGAGTPFHPLPHHPGGLRARVGLQVLSPPAAPARGYRVAPTAHAHTVGPGLASVHSGRG